MILSNIEIWKAIDQGRLVIDPEPLPRRTEYGRKSPYDTTAVDLRLGCEITLPEGGPFNYDLMQPGSISRLISTHSKKFALTNEQPYVLPPNKFILGITLERIAFPILTGRPCLAGRIEGKSSRSRCGLLVHFTAPTVHTGWDGHLALEMINLGPTNFTLRPEMPIAQLIVEVVSGEIEVNPSQFQNQSTPEGLKS